MTARSRSNVIVPGEPAWHAQAAVLATLLLYFLLPDKLIIGPRFVIPTLEGLLLAGLVIATPKNHTYESRLRRRLAILLTGLVSIANGISVFLLAHALLGGNVSDGHQLITASVGVYLTNVLIFGLWYWELDRGGPGGRSHQTADDPDFLFPQMATPELKQPTWKPQFIDYLYVSLTNATAFSPTDTMPLSRRAKTLMGLQALVALVIVALVAARAVNILN